MRRSHGHPSGGAALPISIVECALPNGTAIEDSFVAAAGFRDSYRTALSDASLATFDLFFAIFGFHPWWMKALLIARHWLVSLFGWSTPTVREVLQVRRATKYAVGDKIGVWPIFAISEGELVVGRDNRHLDFRLSIFKEPTPTAPRVVVSTVCLVHNAAGRLYLKLIVPVHRWGVRQLLKRAAQSGRL